MKLPAWTWNWAWLGLMRWSGLQLSSELTAAERWQIAAAVIPACIRCYYVDAFRRWTAVRTPKWWSKTRLEWAGHGWYRIPTQAVAKHCRLRFGVFPIDAGDLLRFHGGGVSHVAYAGPTRTEILEFLPDGELAPEPFVPEMQQAWDAFFRCSRADDNGWEAH